MRHIEPPSKDIVPPSKYKCADTRKLFKAIGNYKFITLEEGVRQMEKELGEMHGKD